jgi:probable DNA repair protein
LESKDPRLEWLASGGTLIVPTRRLGFHIAALFDEAAIRGGGSTWRTPQILTWAELAESQFRRARDASSRPRHWLSQRASRLVWETIVRGDPGAAGLISPERIARRAQRSWHLLHEYLLPYPAPGDAQTPEQRAFAGWASEYRVRLREAGWVDESTATLDLDWRALPAARLGIAGFDELTPRQRRWIDELRAHGHEIVRIAEPTIQASVAQLACAAANDEFEHAARWAAARLDAGGAERLAVIVTDLAARRDDVRRVFDRVFEPATGLAGGPRPGSRRYSIAAARPLSTWPLVASALDALDVFTRSGARASRLLREPHLAGPIAEATRCAELEQRLVRQRGIAPGLSELSAALARDGCPVLAGRLQAVHALASSWPQRAPTSEWALQFSRLLSAAGWASAALDSVDHQVHARWIEMLHELGACDIVTGPVDVHRAVELARALAEDIQFEPEQAPAPLTVVDPETSAGMRFDALWFTGLDATRWPRSATPDPFLPIGWQLHRRMPGASAEICSASARVTFDRVCRSAIDVLISRPQTERDAELLPSPLLADVRAASPPAVWAAPSLTQTVFDARPLLESRPEPSFPPLAAGTEAPGGASLLQHQAACAFRAQARYRLHAEPLESSPTGVEPTLRGQLLHDALSRLWGEIQTSSALAAMDGVSIDAAIRRAVAATLERLARPADRVTARLFELETQWLEARLADVLALDRERPPFSVVAREERYPLMLGGLRLNLQIDRVDRLDSGGHAIIDYKTSHEVLLRHWAGERPEAPQLPAYVLAFGAEQVAAVAFAAVRAGNTAYVGLTRDPLGFPGLTVPGKTRGAVAEFDDWSSMLETWRQRLAALMGEFREGAATLAARPPAACLRCHLHALCRIDAAEREDDEAPVEEPDGD